MAKIIIEDVYKTTGICATVGIGTNLFLATVALDITAKHAKDNMGFLEMSTLQNLGLKVYLINFEVCETSECFPQMGPGSTRWGVMMWLLHGLYMD